MHSTIFYVDDDIDDLEFFKDVTSEINEVVSLFECGDTMLHLLNHPPPNPSVIFLDLNMPVKSGFEILNELKSSPAMSEIPVIILTTSTSPKDISQCKDLGAKLYIRKPTSIIALKKAISYVLTTDWDNYITTDENFFYQPA